MRVQRALEAFPGRYEERRCRVVIHLGAGCAVQAASVVLLTDLQRETALDTSECIRQLKQAGQVRTLSDKPKTLVICKNGNKTAAYLTGVGLRTLQKRMAEETTMFLRLAEQGLDQGRNEVLE